MNAFHFIYFKFESKWVVSFHFLTKMTLEREKFFKKLESFLEKYDIFGY